MAQPQNRKQFKEYIMRRLGFPVVEIAVDAEQVEDRIDDALSYYQDYHFDGSQAAYYKYRLTADDIANECIPVPANVIGITKMVDNFGFGQSSSQNLFDVSYQMMLSDFFNLTASSIVPYYLALRHINLFQELFNATPGIRFNRKMNKIYVDTNWKKYNVGDYMVFDCYETVDPDEFPEVWSDKWLLRYATALVKRQWGANLKLVEGVKLLGGGTLTGQRIFDEAEKEIEELEEEMIHSFSIPLTDMFGPGL
jgi:hypothetical protein